VDEMQVSGLVAEVEAAWNAHDMARFAACFSADADFVNVVGAWWKGRDEIEQQHAASHAGHFRESVMRAHLAAFKEIGPGVGVGHVTWQLEGHGVSGPHRTTEPRRGIWTWTMRERGDALEIVASQNTDIVG
jgi:uncharacterized protein (TIGR02246 family)